jgi:nickel superoxide dismutase
MLIIEGVETTPKYLSEVQEMNTFVSKFKEWFPAEEVSAHCDGPCGVYDPASARIAAEAVLSMTKKMLALTPPDGNDSQAWASYLNTMSRYAAIKEEQAHLAKTELLVLWTDYFKPVHLGDYPDLHDTFWKAAKLCSACKVEVNLQHAEELMEAVHNIHGVFWATKGRDVTYYTAG